MKSNTMHLRLTVSASYDLSEVPEEDREEVREELRARLTDMPTFYAGQGDFTGDTEATLEEWDSAVDETPGAVSPASLAALVTAARDAEKLLSGLFREIDLPGEWERGTGGSIDTLRAALAPFTPDPAPPVSPEIKARLEYLRGEIEAERISYGEIAELQDLAPYIDKDDTVLLEWAGVPEFPEKEVPRGPRPLNAFESDPLGNGRTPALQ